MKNLSSETCQRLKEAGFPQPERAPGQLWYCRGDLCVLYRVIPDGILAASMEWPSHYGATNSEDWVYCPTALEIAEKINCNISFMPSGIHQIVHSNHFKIEQTFNLPESLAEIWLSENEQK